MTHGTHDARDRARYSVALGGLALIFTTACSEPPRAEAPQDSGWEFRAFSRVRPHDSEVLRRLALAQALTRNLAAEAAEDQITSEELASWTAYHWATVDRPPVFRTLHAVVRVKTDASQADAAKAERVAKAIHAAVQGLPDAAAFQKAASGVPSEGLDVKVEALDFVAQDGRVMRLGAKASAQTGAYDPAFARAAAALATVGDVSPVTRSDFGFHVLRLEEKLPELRLDDAARRAMAHKDVLERRARLGLQALLTAERQRLEPTVERSAEEATAKVPVE